MVQFLVILLGAGFMIATIAIRLATAPSTVNLQPWEAVVVTIDPLKEIKDEAIEAIDQTVLAKLSKLSMQSFSEKNFRRLFVWKGQLETRLNGTLSLRRFEQPGDATSQAYLAAIRIPALNVLFHPGNSCVPDPPLR